MDAGDEIAWRGSIVIGPADECRRPVPRAARGEARSLDGDRPRPDRPTRRRGLHMRDHADDVSRGAADVDVLRLSAAQPRRGCSDSDGSHRITPTRDGGLAAFALDVAVEWLAVTIKVAQASVPDAEFGDVH